MHCVNHSLFFVYFFYPIFLIKFENLIILKESRANNLIEGSKSEQLNAIRRDIAEFKKSRNLDKVIVLWTANTERFSDIILGVNDTADNLLAAIKADHSEISPSTIFAVACALEGVSRQYKYPQQPRTHT